mmetsp:Transcript_426/g.596  ORF Transcript_426/g.596 Transcript_426/m.596 type:complete len:307 (+) Transcript_426:172-1092(+)
MVLPISNRTKLIFRKPSVTCILIALFFFSIFSTIGISVLNIHNNSLSSRTDATSFKNTFYQNQPAIQKVVRDTKAPPKEEEDNEEKYKKWNEKKRPMLQEFPRIAQRNDIIGILQQLNFHTAVEVGVQKGLFAKRMLDKWKACTEYKLVDLWGMEQGYEEPGNHSKKWHEMVYNEAKRRMKPYMDKVEFFPMRSTEAANKLKDNHFDFIYLDARHDYCAVKEDIEHYWPKVRPGGILAGHDFIDAKYAIDILGPEEDWSYCEDGKTREPRAVRGAVEDFVEKENIDYIRVSEESFPSWFIQKPYDA